MKPIKLILVDPEVALCVAWRKSFAELPGVEIVNGYFERLPVFDCMVSPANSFGLMDGGIDAAIIAYFGDPLMERVQQRIFDEYLGEQPVGTSIIVETGHPQHPFLAHTPTMRVPMTVAETEHAYLAMWAMLLAVRQHNRGSGEAIETVACPGLCTATGKMIYHEAARQMAHAYQHFLHPPAAPEAMDWAWAMRRHSSVRQRR